MSRHLIAQAGLAGGHNHDNPFMRRTSLPAGLNLGPLKNRPKIEIILENQPAGFRVPSYTTRERIVGHVVLTATSDIPFDDLLISLQGTSRTWVEKVVTAAPTSSQTRAFLTFLRLLQPIEESEMPEQHILRAGRTYKIPFEFVVPERLLPQTCSHTRENTSVEVEHLKLPPSFGDALVSGDGKRLQKDHAPEMNSITYSIRCIITRKPRSAASRKPFLIADYQEKLRIIPRVDELPPLAISDEPGEDYVLHKNKKVKKGILLGKTMVGRIDAKVKQPAALRLPCVRAAANPDGVEPVTTVVNVKLRFNPAKPAFKPPKLQMLWSRLKIGTFFSTVAQKSFPSRSASFSTDINKSLMVETLPLGCLNLGGVQWIKRTADRRDSGFAFDVRKGSVDANASPDETSGGTPIRSPSPSPATTPANEEGPEYSYYTADVTVPIELPYQNHAFVPTFHSCLISRIYALDLSISSTAGPANSTNIHLKVPVQIMSTGSANPVSLDGMIPEGGFIGARAEDRDVFAPNAARADDDDDELPPSFDELSIHDTTDATNTALQPEVDPDGEFNFRRPTWIDPERLAPIEPANLAAEVGSRHLTDDGIGSPGTRSPGTRSPSPRHTRLTNDQIMNPEDYEGAESEDRREQHFGSFSVEPRSFARPGEGANRGQASNGQTRRASETLPPGYDRVAAGTMLMGTGGLVRALN